MHRVIPTVGVDLQPRRNSCPVCSRCRRKRPDYDRQPAHSIEFIPLSVDAVPYRVY